AGPHGPTRSVALAPDGKSVLTVGDDEVLRVRGLDPAAASRTVSVAPAWKTRLRASWFPDGQRVLTLEAKARIRTLSGEVAFEFGTESPVVGAVSADGKAVALGRLDGKVDVWDAAASPPKLRWSIPAHTSYVATAAFSPDGTRLATGGNDHWAHVWDLTGKDPVAVHRLGMPGQPGPGHNVYVIAWGPDGKSLAIGRDARVEV